MNHVQRPLLRRTYLQPHESLPSLVIRAAADNGYHSATMITWLCHDRLSYQDSITRPKKSQTYTVLENLIRIAAEDLYAASVHRFATTMMPPTSTPQAVMLPAGQKVPVMSNAFLRAQAWPESDAQFCPLCLQEAAYHRLEWMPLAISMCLTHQCLLVRGCPQCHTALAITDIVETRCSTCDLDLTTVFTPNLAADSPGILAQTLIQAWLGIHPAPESGSCGSLPMQPSPVLYRLLEGFRKTIMRVNHSWPQLHQPPSGTFPDLFPCTSKRDITPAKSYILYTTAFQGLVDWPNGFHAFLDVYRMRDGRTEQGSVYHDLRYIYAAWLQKAWRHPDFQFVQQAFDQYLLIRYPNLSTCLRRSRESLSPPLGLPEE